MNNNPWTDEHDCAMALFILQTHKLIHKFVCVRFSLKTWNNKRFPAKPRPMGSHNNRRHASESQKVFFFFSAVWAPCSYRFYCTYHPTRAKLRLCPWTSCAPFGCDLHGDLCVQWVISDMETVEERCHQHPGVQRVKKRSFWCMLTTECTRVGVFVVCFFSA